MSKRRRTAPPRGLERLPVVLQHAILAFLPLVDVLGRLPRVCRAWRSDMPAYAIVAEPKWSITRLDAERALMEQLKERHDAVLTEFANRATSAITHERRLSGRLESLRRHMWNQAQIESLTRALEDDAEWVSYVRDYERRPLLRSLGNYDFDEEDEVTNRLDRALFDAYLHLTPTELRAALEFIRRFALQTAREEASAAEAYIRDFSSSGENEDAIACICREGVRLHLSHPGLAVYIGRNDITVFVRRTLSRRCVHDDIVRALRQPDGGRGHPSIDALPADKRAELQALVRRESGA